MNDLERQGATAPSGAIRRLLLSAAIVSVLGIQALASIGKRPIHWWPFLSYPMYRSARYAGDAVTTYRLYGIARDGSERLLVAADFGLNFQKFRSGLIDAIKNAELDRVLRFAEIYRTRNRDRSIVAFRLESREAVWRDDRVDRLPPRTLARVEFAP